MRLRLLGLGVMLACLAACATSAPSSRQKIELLSWNHGFITELGRPDEGSLQEVEGSLMLPPGASQTERLPAAIILHAGTGQGAQDWFYAKLLNSWGVAAMAINSFDPRDVKNTVGDQSAVSEASILEDAYAGLNYLSRHPRIDPDRIIIIGFSKGATPALLAALQRFRDRLAEGSNHFAGHIAYYPWCGFAFLNHRTTGAPILVMSGAEDSITPAPLCEQLTERWAMTNPDTDVEMVTYPNAGHAFEYPHPFLEMVGSLPVIGEVPRYCFIAEQEPGVFVETRSQIRVDGSTIRAALNLCATWTHDAEVLFNEEAQADLRQRLHRFIAQTLLTRPRQQATVGASK